jgi:hypothetical protein
LFNKSSLGAHHGQVQEGRGEEAGAKAGKGSSGGGATAREVGQRLPGHVQVHEEKPFHEDPGTDFTVYVWNRRMKQTKEDLLAILESIAAHVREDDSFEGRISYTCMAEGLARGEFEVEAFYRIGNSEGQGGAVQYGSASSGSV